MKKDNMGISTIKVLALLFLHMINDMKVNASVSSSQSHPNDQPYRTAYHFQPIKNWMNVWHWRSYLFSSDPNGPMYYKGVYHMFYQYNPYSAVWGNISWAHSISYDLVNWIHLDIAISPAEPYDIYGCWSGSVTILPGEKPAILYTGSDTEKHQVQNLAVPKNLSDPFLREWVKSPKNPLITPVNDLDPDLFRDPTTAWQGPDGLWRVIVGNEVNGHGRALLYRSKDFVNWTRSRDPLHSSNNTIMWECPDFYPVSENSKNGLDTSAQGEFMKHVLKASFDYHDSYIFGKYTPNTDSFIVESEFYEKSDLRYDYGKFYASKSFFDDAKNRRVLWAWVDESDSEAENKKKGWSGLQSVPRTIVLSENRRQLLLWPIEEITKLRKKEVSFHDKELKGESVSEVQGITAAQADIEVFFELPNLQEVELMDPSWENPQLLCTQKKTFTRGSLGPFGILALASEDLKEQTAVFFRIFKGRNNYYVLMCSDQSRSSLKVGLDNTTYGAFIELDPHQDMISLRSLIDHSIIESFGGEGRACMTARVYPKLAIDGKAHLFVFNNGTVDVKISRLSAWSMKKAQIFPAAASNRRRKTHLN